MSIDAKLLFERLLRAKEFDRSSPLTGDDELLHEIDILSVICIVLIYQISDVARSRPDLMERLLGNASLMPTLMFSNETDETAFARVFNRELMGSNLPFERQGLRRGGYRQVAVLEGIYRFIGFCRLYYFDRGLNDAEKTLQFADQEGPLANTPPRLQERVLDLPHLVKESAVEWSDCIAELLLECPRFPSRLKRDLISLAASDISYRTRARQKQRRERLEKKLQDCGELSALEATRLQAVSKEIDAIRRSKGDIRNGVKKMLLREFKRRLKI